MLEREHGNVTDRDAVVSRSASGMRHPVGLPLREHARLHAAARSGGRACCPRFVSPASFDDRGRGPPGGQAACREPLRRPCGGRRWCRRSACRAAGGSRGRTSGLQVGPPSKRGRGSARRGRATAPCHRAEELRAWSSPSRRWKTSCDTWRRGTALPQDPAPWTGSADFRGRPRAGSRSRDRARRQRWRVDPRFPRGQLRLAPA